MHLRRRIVEPGGAAMQAVSIVPGRTESCPNRSIEKE
jgi:hypothetical protein